MAKEEQNPRVFSPSSEKNCVVLYDWWLVRAQAENGDKMLSVSGLTTKKQAQRIFTSAPIIKRHDTFMVETCDNIRVILQGMINHKQMQENGFSPDVCKRFLIGFPLFWERYIENNTPNITPSTDNSNYSNLLKELASNAKKIVDLDLPKDDFCKDTPKSGTSNEKELNKDGKVGTNYENMADEFATEFLNVVKSKKYGTSLHNCNEKMEKDGILGNKKSDSIEKMEIGPSQTLENGTKYNIFNDEMMSEGSSNLDKNDISRGKKLCKKTKRVNRRKKKVEIKNENIDQTPCIDKSKEPKTPITHINYDEITSPCDNWKRTRSGRIIVPTLDKGSQKIVYDQNGNIAGVASISPPIGSISEPSKKRRKFT